MVSLKFGWFIAKAGDDDLDSKAKERPVSLLRARRQTPKTQCGFDGGADAVLRPCLQGLRGEDV